MEPDRKVFLSNLDRTFKAKELTEFFSKLYKSIRTCRISQSKFNNRDTEGSLSYGTLYLSSEEEVNDIVNKKTFFFKGKNFTCTSSFSNIKLQNYKKDVKKRRGFLHNINPKLDDKMLYECISQKLNILDAYIIKKGKKKRKTNHGYVMFKELSEAEEVFKLGWIDTQFGKISITSYKDNEELQVVKKEEISEEYFGISDHAKRRKKGKRKQNLEVVYEKKKPKKLKKRMEHRHHEGNLFKNLDVIAKKLNHDIGNLVFNEKPNLRVSVLRGLSLDEEWEDSHSYQLSFNY